MVINHQMGDTTRLVDIHNRPRWGGGVCMYVFVRMYGGKDKKTAVLEW